MNNQGGAPESNKSTQPDKEYILPEFFAEGDLRSEERRKYYKVGVDWGMTVTLKDLISRVEKLEKIIAKYFDELPR